MATESQKRVRRRNRYRSEIADLPPLRRKPAGRSRIRTFRAQASLPHLPVPATSAAPLTPARWISALLVLACIGLGAWLFASDAFYVYATEVEGNQLITRDQVVTTSRLEGMNIFFVRPDAVAAELKKLPYVLAAQVKCGLPNRVHIRLTERQPAVTWQVGDARYAVDREGVVLPTPPLSDTLAIRVLSGNPPQFGDKVDASAIAMVQAIQKLRPDATGLVYTADHGVGLETSQGWTVYLGEDPAQLADQLSLLDRLAPELQTPASRIDYLDLRFPASPYLKEK
jgi:cell division septal protein FtsQ